LKHGARSAAARELGNVLAEHARASAKVAGWYDVMRLIKFITRRIQLLLPNKPDGREAILRYKCRQVGQRPLGFHVSAAHPREAASPADRFLGTADRLSSDVGLGHRPFTAHTATPAAL
jgi:hypothetical protein